MGHELLPLAIECRNLLRQFLLFRRDALTFTPQLELRRLHELLAHVRIDHEARDLRQRDQRGDLVLDRWRLLHALVQ